MSAARDLAAGSHAVARRLAWHALERDDVFRALDSSEHGLSRAESAARLERVGPNELPRQPPPSRGEVLFRQFQSPLIVVLGLAALGALVLGEVADAAFIGIVLALNAAIGGFQEWRAERESRALQRLLQIRATVVRDGEAREVAAESLVPGDLVWLESGNRVPADIRLVSSHGLEVDESLLTGESLAVLKDAAWVGAESTPLADRRNIASAGTFVSRGRGKGIVVATGSRTSVGELAVDVLSGPSGKPPLALRMERFTRAVGVAALASAAAVVFAGVAGAGRGLAEMFLFAVALAVSVIPEGLPVAMTVALAVATTRMARRGVIVRRLAAVEGLGSCTLIASDKTGTLTCNELTVREVRLPDGQRLEVSGEGFEPRGEVLLEERSVARGEVPGLDRLALAAVLSNEGDLHRRDGRWIWRGDPTDVALLSFARKLGWEREAALDRYPQVNQIPFEPEYRFAATFHRFRETVRVVVKGAPERVLAMCTARAEIPQMAALAVSMAERGFRVLALAEGAAPPGLDASQPAPPPVELEFLGFLGMIDPLRPGVREAVAAAQQAGIAVSMVTGDHAVTALAIARELGFASEPSQVVTGQELEAKSPAELAAFVDRTRVFARVAPRQKLDIVEAAQAAGHLVAVTGDGVNDAPALRTANIGVAMGRSGTDVAREAADLVLSDDNFATIIAGVEEGRVAYDNIRKVIYLLVSTGAAEVVLVGLSVLTGLPLPLLPAQLLWLNLVTNGIQDVALAFEPNEGGVLRRQPRPPRERIFNRLMLERTGIAALVIGGVAFAAFDRLLAAGWSEASARNALLLLMVLFENVHIGNCRSETRSALLLSPLRSPILLAGAITALAVHLIAMYVPITRTLLRVEPVGPDVLLPLFGLALTVFVAIEIHKLAWKLRGRNAR